MPVAPHISKSVQKRLQKLNPHFSARWNGWYEKWDIWFNDTIKTPYIVLRTPSIDGDTFKQLQYAMWVSQHIRYHCEKGLAKSEEMKQKKLRDEEDLYKEMGKEAAPLLRTIANAGTASHGRSVTMFPGIGTGTV